MGTAPCHVSSPAALICLWPWLQPGECTHTLPAELGLGTMSQLQTEANNLHSLFMVEKKVVLRLLPRRCQGQRGAEGKARGCTEKSHRHCLSCSAAVLTLHNRLSSQSLAAAKSNEPRCTAGTVCAFWSRDQQEETNLCLTLCPAFLPATHMHLLAPGHLLSQQLPPWPEAGCQHLVRRRAVLGGCQCPPQSGGCLLNAVTVLHSVTSTESCEGTLPVLLQGSLHP